MNKIVDFNELQSDGDKFEHVVCRLLERKGLRLIRPRASGPDKGRDLIFEESMESLILQKKRRWVVQCKLSKSIVNWNKIQDIEKTLRCYSADSYLLVVSSDVTENLMDYLEKCSEEFDITRWTYLELEEELLSNLDLFGEFLPKSYSTYMNLWRGVEIDICSSFKKTNHAFTKLDEWDSSGRWHTYHTGWVYGNLKIKRINKKNTIILENSKESNITQFGVALYGEMHGSEYRNLNICRPKYMSFSYMNDGNFVCNLQVLGEDKRVYFLAYYTSDIIRSPNISEDPAGIKYANYCIGDSKKKRSYCKVERLITKDLLKLYSVEPLIIDRICFTVTRSTKIKSIKFKSTV
jgi:Holliday junction resolvase-like predicted endonuclease